MVTLPLDRVNTAAFINSDNCYEALTGIFVPEDIRTMRAIQESGGVSIDTMAHCTRVGFLALSSLQVIGLEEDNEEALFLHDVGKGKTMRHILESATPLSPAERSVVNTHAILGAEALITRRFSRPEIALQAAKYALLHHENYPTREEAMRFAAHYGVTAEIQDALTPGSEQNRKIAALRTADIEDALNDNTRAYRAARFKAEGNGRPPLSFDVRHKIIVEETSRSAAQCAVIRRDRDIILEMYREQDRMVAEIFGDIAA